MAEFDAYIPMDRRQALYKGKSLPERTTGAALFADVFGFTPLTGALVAELGSKRGAEEVLRHINSIYEALIAELHRYGGSVIGFVGDAITCWLDDSPVFEGPSAPARGSQRAVACGLAMQEAMEQFTIVKTTSGTTISLGVKIAVAAGPVSRLLVGDPDVRVIEALAGATLERMAKAEKQAKKGEVVVSQEVVEQLGERVRVQEWREGGCFAVIRDLQRQPGDSYLGSDCYLTEIMTQPWMMPPIYERLRLGNAFLGELRPVVPLFLKFRTLDYDHDEGAGAKLDAYIRWVQSIVARYGGILVDLTIGDKGCFLYAAFGAPISHHNDAERAVAAALELRRLPVDLQLFGPLQIGISRGEVWTGACGARRRKKYAVMGNQVNMSIRLMSKAKPGQILVHDRIVEAVSNSAYRFNSLGQIMVKGRATPLPVSEVVGVLEQREVREQWQPSHALVGRKREMAHLEAALDGLEVGKSDIIIMEGEPGIGKSRLVAELMMLIETRGLKALLGAGQSIEQHTPYRAWRDIFNAYFELDRVPDSHQRQQHVRRVVEEMVPEQIERLPLLNDVLNLGLPDTELTASLEPALHQKSLLLFLLTLLRASTGKRPLILILEDAHWLDSLSWEAAVQMARGLRTLNNPFLLLLVTRPLDEHSVGRRHLASLQALPATTLALESLSHEETIALVANRLGVEALPKAVAELVRIRAEGNPFFAEELVLTLRDQGLIRLEKRGNIIISDHFGHASQTLPNTLQGLILARIDRLSPQKKLTLKVAAVIGRTFGYMPLYYTLNEHLSMVEQTLKKQLEDLSGRDLTKLETPEPELTYIFKHIITQEVTYQTLLFAQRRQLHRTVAKWYETTFGDSEQEDGKEITRALSPYLPLLVHHYHHAEESERERHYAKLAGEQAATQYANSEATHYFSRALDLTAEDEIESRYDLLLARESVYHVQGARKAQLGDLKALQDLLQILPDEQHLLHQKKAEVSLRQAKYGWMINDYPSALSAVQQAIAQATQAQLPAIKAKAYHIWGGVLLQQGDYKAAQSRSEEALRLARASDQQTFAADSLHQLGRMNFHLGNLTAALKYFNESLHIHRALNNRKDEAVCLMMLGVVYSQQGEYLAGQQYYQQTLMIYQKIGYRMGETWVLGNLGLNYCGVGDYEKSREYQQQALLISQEIGNRLGEEIILSNLALTHYQLGHYRIAQDYCEQALAVHQKISNRSSVGYTLTYLGHILVDSGQLSQAAAAYQEAIQIRRELGEEKLVMDDLAGLARVALKEGKNKQALPYVAEILAWLDANGIEGIEYPLQVYLTCYQVLRASANGKAEILARTQAILITAHTLLQEQAAKIKDEALRRKFLQNVPFNREIVEAWEARSQVLSA